MAIKLHIQYDTQTSIPVFIHITPASTHNVNAIDELIYEPGNFYIFDRGYIDFERLFHIHQNKSFFVIRGKSNLQFNRLYSNTVDKSTGVRCDQIGNLKGFYSRHGYPEKIRRIKFYDSDQKRKFIFLANKIKLRLEEIAELYKHR